MSDRDSRTESWGRLDGGLGDGTLPSVAIETATGVVEESAEGETAMVACDVGVQVLADALDAVGVGAVGRQEVQDDAATEAGEGLARETGLVDAVVVEDEVDAARASIATGEQPEQLAEERGVLAVGPRGVQAPGTHVERAGQVELLILARRDDAALVTAQHPVAPDLRVEVDVDLVGAEHRLLGARAGFEPANRSQNTQPSVASPGTKHDGLRRAEPRPDPRQRPAHRAHGHRREAFELHLQAEQLTGPGRSLPSAVLRCAAQQAHQYALEPLVSLALAVASPPGVQPSR